MIREAIPQSRRGAAFGLIGITTGIAAGLRPPLGGLLVHAFGWSAIFWANVPVIAVALGLGWRSLPRVRPTGTIRSRFDVVGTLLLTSSLALVILIPTALRFGNPALAIGVGVLGGAVGWAFACWEPMTAAPVLDLRLFAPPRFSAACAAVGLGNLVMYTTLLTLPLFLQGTLNRAVQTSGFVLSASYSVTLVARQSRRTTRASVAESATEYDADQTMRPERKVNRPHRAKGTFRSKMEPERWGFNARNVGRRGDPW